MAAIKKRIWKNRSGTKSQSWGYDVRDGNGNRFKKSGFKTKVDAEDALATLKTKINKGELVKENKTLTFRDAVNQFIENHMNIYIKGSTKEGYVSCLNKHILPYFGKKKLLDVTPTVIKTFIKKKIDDKYTPKTINNILSIMSTVMSKMVDEEIIANNPLARVKKLPQVKQEMKYLTTEQINLVLDIAEKHYPDFYPVLFVSVASGVRKSELTCLTWEDVDFQNRTISVNKSLYRKEIITTKTKSSVRKIDMPEKLVKVLKAWKLKSKPNENNFIFCNTNGKGLDLDHLIKTRFKKILKTAEIPEIRWHDLRHSYTSALIAQNLNIKYVSSQLGHSSCQITMDRYAHIMPESHEKGKEALDIIFSNKKETSKIKSA